MTDDLVKRLRGWANADEKSIELFGQMMRDAADRIEALLEDRARFPDKPDMIGRMIEAHIGNLKLLKELAERDAIAAADRIAALEAENKMLRAMALGFMGVKPSFQMCCSVCGIGKDGRSMAYACARADCPTLARALEGKTHD